MLAAWRFGQSPEISAIQSGIFASLPRFGDQPVEPVAPMTPSLRIFSDHVREVRPRLTVRFVSAPHLGHTQTMSSNSSVAGRMVLASIGSLQPGHRTIGKFSNASQPMGTLRIEVVPSLLSFLA